MNDRLQASAAVAAVWNSARAAAHNMIDSTLCYIKLL